MKKENFQRRRRNQFLKKKKKNRLTQSRSIFSETRIGIKYSFLLCRTRTSLGGAQSFLKETRCGQKKKKEEGEGEKRGTERKIVLYGEASNGRVWKVNFQEEEKRTLEL